MSLNNYKENEIQVEPEFNKLNISNSVNANYKYCCEPYSEKLWCKECLPHTIIEGWSSGNCDIDKFIKNTIYNATYAKYGDDDDNVENMKYPLFLEWVPFDKFIKLEQIGQGGFAKVYSATWIDGKAKYVKQDDGSWKKLDPEHMKVALKRLNRSQNISAKYLNELKTHWDLYNLESGSLKFYGITRDSRTKEFMMVMQLAEEGNLRSFLSSNFNKILWKDKVMFLRNLTYDLKNLHKLGYSHKDFHSGNILQHYNSKLHRYSSYIADFGLSGPANEQKSDNKVYGVLPFIAPEVLNGRPYTPSSDIYSVGVIMTECSSGKPPFYKRSHDACLALEICNGLRPEFGMGTPGVYKKLAYKCMDANPNQRPKANELYEILRFWLDSICKVHHQEKFGYKGKEIKTAFEEADKVIPNILNSSYERNPGAIYTSRAFTFTSYLSKPVNSSIITSYVNGENKGCQDSRLFDLEVTNSFELIKW